MAGQISGRGCALIRQLANGDGDDGVYDDNEFLMMLVVCRPSPLPSV